MDGFKYLTKFLLNKSNFLLNKTFKNNIPISSYENFNNVYFELNTNLINQNFLVNNIFKDIYKNFYKTNILAEHSVNMNMLSTLFFNKKSNFKL